MRGPAAVARYLKGAAAPAGHNPLGALSVLALLLVIGFQAVSGLFTTDDIMTQGPLFGHVSEAVSAAMTSWHKLNEWVILALVALHIAAVLWYALVRRKRLVRAIITGKVDAKDVPAGTPPTQDGFAVWLRALVLGAVSRSWYCGSGRWKSRPTCLFPDGSRSAKTALRPAQRRASIKCRVE